MSAPLDRPDVMDAERRNHDSGRCDCGNLPRYRVPLDDLVNVIYGYDEAGGFIDVCGDCWHEIVSTGNGAYVIDRVLRVDATGTTSDPGDTWRSML